MLLLENREFTCISKNLRCPGSKWELYTKRIRPLTIFDDYLLEVTLVVLTQTWIERGGPLLFGSFFQVDCIQIAFRKKYEKAGGFAVHSHYLGLFN